MYNSVIECVKGLEHIYWVKKDLFGLTFPECVSLFNPYTTTVLRDENNRVHNPGYNIKAKEAINFTISPLCFARCFLRKK